MQRRQKQSRHLSCVLIFMPFAMLAFFLSIDNLLKHRFSYAYINRAANKTNRFNFENQKQKSCFNFQYNLNKRHRIFTLYCAISVFEAQTQFAIAPNENCREKKDVFGIVWNQPWFIVYGTCILTCLYVLRLWGGIRK